MAEKLVEPGAELAPGYPATPEQIAKSLNGLAMMLGAEQGGEERTEAMANQGTVDCRMCHGLRTYFDGRERIQCPRCHGWGREQE
jgi:hypothetical protein